MSELSDNQWEVGGVLLGRGTNVLIGNVEGLGKAEVRDRRTSRPGEDGHDSGREYLAGRVLTFEGSVVAAGDPEHVWDGLSALNSAFDDEAVRLTPRAVMPLRFKRPGRQALIAYGRPGKFDPDPKVIAVGLGTFSATFDAESSTFYSDVEHIQTLRLSPASSGGLVAGPFGLASPMRTIAATRRTSVVDNAGDRATWPVITIDGPITDPGVDLASADGSERLWALRLRTTIGINQSIVIDTRPWARTVLRNDGVSLGDSLGRSSYLSDAKIPKGLSEVLVSGADPTGSARFRVAHRDAYKSA